MNKKETSSQNGKGQTASGQECRVSFPQFVYLMSSQALIQMGEVPNPLTGKRDRNLQLAQHSIEVLSMIEEKTRGNLTDEEKQTIRDTLYNLRMRFVEATEKQNSKG